MKNIVISLLLVALFAIAVISFGINLAQNNNAPQSIADDPTISKYFVQIKDSAQSSVESSNSALEAMSKSPLSLTTGYYIVVAMGGIWKTIVLTPIRIYNITTELILQRIFGDEQYYAALGIVGAIIILSIVFGVYKLLSTGQPE